MSIPQERFRDDVRNFMLARKMLNKFRNIISKVHVGFKKVPPRANIISLHFRLKFNGSFRLFSLHV